MKVHVSPKDFAKEVFSHDQWSALRRLREAVDPIKKHQENKFLKSLDVEKLNSAIISAREELALGKKEISERNVFDIMQGWGNAGMAADFEYLLKVSENASSLTDGMILECGSGASTIILSLYVEKNKSLSLCTLEHKDKWVERVKKAKVLIDNSSRSNLLKTDLVNYGSYSWYDITNIPREDTISLVVCDGPPGMTRGGRYGLLPQVRCGLKNDAVILLDDAGRQHEKQILEMWKKEYSINYKINETPGGSYATVRLS